MHNVASIPHGTHKENKAKYNTDELKKIWSLKKSEYKI